MQLLPALAKFSDGFAMVMRKARGIIFLLPVRNASQKDRKDITHVEFSIYGMLVHNLPAC